jgi:hypothetical protein
MKTRYELIQLLSEAYNEELRSLTIEQLEEEWSDCWARENCEEDETNSD